jgi:hypothetical protein
MHELSHALRRGRPALTPLWVAVRVGVLMGVLVGALAACQSGPQGPLAPMLSPLDQSERYGYLDHTLGSDRFEVIYFGPRHTLASFAPNPSDVETQPARTEALDLATWHAAEIALTHGFKGFRVVDHDVHVDSSPGSFYGGAGMDPIPTWRYPGGFTYGSQGYAPPANTYVQARATLTVVLTNDLQPGDLDAAATIDRLRAQYPGAESETSGRAP